MKVIFSKNDFSLCHVPVPKGYPQSQTHSGVAFYDGRYFLTASPYPDLKEKRLKVYAKVIARKFTRGRAFNTIRAEAYENPCLYAGNSIDRNPPIEFKLLQERPLMDTPDDYYGLPAFNSDPDIFAEDGKLYILNRPVYRTKLCPGKPLNKYENRVYLISGEIDGERFKLERNLRLLSTTERIMASPCFFKYNNRYWLIELETNSYNDGETYKGLYAISALERDGLKDNDHWKLIETNSTDLLPWHMSVFQYDGNLYAIVACIKKGERGRCWQMLGEFNKELSSMKIYGTPLTDYKSYRGAACVTPEGEFVLYNTTVHEKIKGSIAVDGRDVIMAHAPFIKVLEQLRNNE